MNHLTIMAETGIDTTETRVQISHFLNFYYVLGNILMLSHSMFTKAHEVSAMIIFLYFTDVGN